MSNPIGMHASKKTILDWFRTGELERAFDALDHSAVSMLDADIGLLLADFGKALEEAVALGDGQNERKIRHRVSAFTRCLASDFNPSDIVPIISIPPRHRGKILLLSMLGGLLDGLVCVRSNDLYHRDILRNAQLEISDLGLRSTSIHPLGGACLRDGGKDDRVTIWGGSDDFGACDKEFLVELLIPFYPGRAIVIED